MCMNYVSPKESLREGKRTRNQSTVVPSETEGYVLNLNWLYNSNNFVHSYFNLDQIVFTVAMEQKRKCDVGRLLWIWLFLLLCEYSCYFESQVFSTVNSVSIHQPGDDSHILPDEENVKKLIGEEKDRTSFTAVVITGITPEHLHYLKTHFNYWCKQLK